MEQDLSFLVKNLPKLPGVYRMLDELGQLLYVGKAKSLRVRVGSYFQQRDQSLKTRHLVARIRDIQITVTASETEALLLEQTLIKRHGPPYNILMRDDKSYPYIFISQHEYPRMSSLRGRRRRHGSGTVFGPFPNGSAVRFSLSVLQKAFRVRQCQDSYYRNRSRPCLEYQIKRCSAPCVGLISKQEYQQSVNDTVRFLEGKSSELMAELVTRMDGAAQKQDYEAAAMIRDQIATLRQVQEVQHVDTADGDIDVFAVCQDTQFICVQTLVIRQGQLIGGKSHFQKLHIEVTHGEILESFVAQYYLNEAGSSVLLPHSVLTNYPVPNPVALEAVLKELVPSAKMKMLKRALGHKQAWLNMAVQNAEQALKTRHVTHSRKEETYTQLREWLSPDLPKGCVNRFECFDISHTQGEATKASCVVFDHEGPRKDLYRSYNIQSTHDGDDYQAMAEVIQRRYSKLDENAEWPWLIVIDGGKGQLGHVARVLKTIVVNHSIPEVVLIGVAKGVTRKAGFESIFRITSLNQWFQSEVGEPASYIEQLQKPEDESVLHLVQHIRDESHRFAIIGHRKARDKARTHSSLDDIPGVGPKRRSALLKYFGGLQGVKRASIDDLIKVAGIQRSLADVIYNSLRGEDIS